MSYSQITYELNVHGGVSNFYKTNYDASEYSSLPFSKSYIAGIQANLGDGDWHMHLGLNYNHVEAAKTFEFDQISSQDVLVFNYLSPHLGLSYETHRFRLLLGQQLNRLLNSQSRRKGIYYRPNQSDLILEEEQVNRNAAKIGVSPFAELSYRIKDHWRVKARSSFSHMTATQREKTYFSQHALGISYQFNNDQNL